MRRYEQHREEGPDLLTNWLTEKIDEKSAAEYIDRSREEDELLVNKKSTKPTLKDDTKKTVKAEGLFAPKCRNCSGFEEKLSAVEQDEIKGEVSLMHKHEIIRQMSSFIGTDVRALTQAEELFDSFKYMIAEYVVKHEFNCDNKLSVQMVLWLEEKCQPTAINPLHDLISQYLNKRA